MAKVDEVAIVLFEFLVAVRGNRVRENQDELRMGLFHLMDTQSMVGWLHDDQDEGAR